MRMPFFSTFTRQISVAISLFLMSAATASAETPLEGFNTGSINFPTAETLPQRALAVSIGSHQTIGSSTGTGSQFYYGGLEYGLTDDLQLGFAAGVIQDPNEEPILGLITAINFRSFGLNAKYRFVNTDRIQASALVSVEDYAFKTDIFNME